jgi:RNA polymerase sigma-70 factor, ECF subfamily
MRQDLTKATELLQSKRPESVEEAVRLLQNTVYSFSMKVCGHREDAQDTMQEVLIRSLPHLAKISEPKALAVWLYTVARNHCWRMRRKSVNAPRQTLSLDELMPDKAELGLLLQDSAANAEDRLLDDEQRQLLRTAILSIPLPYRLVLVLHDMEDLDTEQTAKVLGIQPGTVRVRLHRARLSVRKEMARLTDGAMAAGAAAPKSSRKPAKKKVDVGERPPECRELFANLSEYLDGRIEPEPCEQMREHIEACPACVAFIRDLRLAIDRCRSLDVSCDADIAPKLRTLLTREYVRLLGSAAPKNKSLSL